MREIVIGTRVFPAKKGAQTEIYAVRERYINETWTLDDDEFLRDLVALHPEAASKVGAGIERFDVRKNANNFGFWIRRVDGSETDFSFAKCLNDCGIEDLARSTMRNAVQDQVALIREAAVAAGWCCPISRECLTSDNCHVDHDQPTFVEIADGFAGAEGGYERIMTVAMDGKFGQVFADPQQEARWAETHRAHARLRAVSKKTNLSTLRRGVRRRQRS